MDIKYCVDFKDRNRIVGWAYFESNPETPVILSLNAGPRKLIEFYADRPRNDLALAGFPRSGQCAFDINLSNLLDAQNGLDLILRDEKSQQVLETVKGADIQYRSGFGGFWIDQSNFLDILREKVESNIIPKDLILPIVEFALKGYVVFKQAIPKDLLEKMNDDVDQIWLGNCKNIFIETYQFDEKLKYVEVDPIYKNGKNKLLDIYIASNAAREIMLNSQITKFLETIFEDKVQAFQSLSFLFGSEQPIHKDTAFVRVYPPMHLAASWIALEDVKVGSGELEYFVGSHHDPEYLFSSNKKWSDETPEEIERYCESLIQDAAEYNHPKESFIAKAGDVLIWHADLAHGGGKITDSTLTRKSLVTHYCPLKARPFYTNFRKNKSISIDGHKLISNYSNL